VRSTPLDRMELPERPDPGVNWENLASRGHLEGLERLAYLAILALLDPSLTFSPSFNSCRCQQEWTKVQRLSPTCKPRSDHQDLGALQECKAHLGP